MNREDRQIRELLLKMDTMSSKHEGQLHGRIMRKLPTRSLRRICLVFFFTLLWGGGIALFVCYWREIAHAMLAMSSALLDYQVPSMETIVMFALCVGAVVLIIVQSVDVLNEYYEREIKDMISGLTGCE